jgi:hypothetical protein
MSQAALIDASHWQRPLSLWGRWVLACAVAGSAGLLISADGMAFSVGFLPGILLGPPQWLVLRRYGVRAWWLVATVAGCILGWLVCVAGWLLLFPGIASIILAVTSLLGVTYFEQALETPGSSMVFLVAGLALGGATIGAIQTMALPPNGGHAGRPSLWAQAVAGRWWVLANAIACPVFWTMLFNLAGDDADTRNQAISGCLAGVVYGAITGLALVRRLLQLTPLLTANDGAKALSD